MRPGSERTMSEPDNVRPIGTARRLADAIRDVKNAAADRSDVVVELREASRTRLDLMAAELAPVFAEVPDEIDLFDFTISSGLQPRLWIDAVAHVALARDRRTYLFLKDTRLGRVVLAESPQIKPVADQVTRYIAERMVERQVLLDGVPEPAVPGLRDPSEPPEASSAGTNRSLSEFMAGVGLVGAGALVGFSASIALLWDKLAALVTGGGR